MIFLYDCFIALYSLVAKLMAIAGHKKAKLWVEGRAGDREEFKKYALQQSPLRDSPRRIVGQSHQTLWFHFASLGEYEQGRPVMEKLKSERKNIKIVATFFSPSGYEYCKDTQLIDYKFYLPADIESNAKKFVEFINPSEVFFIKYEFWYHYLHILKEKKIPVYLVSGLFRRKQVFFKWYGGLHRKMLSCFTHFFVQNESAQKLLQSLNYNNVTVTGDTRYDRCLQIADTPYINDIIKDFIGQNFCLVAGSTWTEDENIILNHTDKFKIILAPHDISRSESLYKQFSDSVLFSQYNNNSDKNILIIDNIGMLANIYRFASIAYVGGAFGSGLHNIIEPLSHGKPVILGPKTDKFPEAAEAINAGVAHQIEMADELYIIAEKYISNDTYLQQQQNRAKQFAVGNKGAAEKILRGLY
ncbi:MAG: glycosyltransferase N-terminal domain-containing protein [Bacteroidota bacterium]|nr:glycosyltransferase N-terminal domain-containing protein [Bacteroidota bacterium]